jgi:hypothetical protein
LAIITKFYLADRTLNNITSLRFKIFFLTFWAFLILFRLFFNLTIFKFAFRLFVKRLTTNKAKPFVALSAIKEPLLLIFWGKNLSNINTIRSWTKEHILVKKECIH